MKRTGFVVHLWLVLLLGTAGCATNRITRPNNWAPATQVDGRTVWTFAWGAFQQNINPTNCLGPGLAEVTVKSNLGFSLISVLSLGTAMPVRIEWRCAKKSPTDGDDF
jgi:hypothetical protein